MPDDDVRAVAVDSENNKWAGTYNGGLAMFDDTEWIVYTTSNSGLSRDKVISIAIDPEGNKCIGTERAGLCRFNGVSWSRYLSNETVNTTNFDSEGNIWVGTENGLAVFDNTEWTFYNSTNSGLSNNSVTAVDFDSLGNSWIGTYGGGFFHFDGTNWTNYNRYNSVLPDIWIKSIIVEENGNKLIGTEGGGLVIFNENGVVVSVDEEKSSELLNEFALSQNYPNPFNPSTKISYSIQEHGNVELKVFDVLGREVVTLVNKKQKSGDYEVNFDAGNLSSGIYFYRLQSGNFVKSMKMILLK